MKRHFENLTDKVGRAVQHWWLLMLAGILCFACGIAVFAFPLESYVVISILVGVVMLFTGAAQLIIASSSGNYLAMRGYMIVGGIVDLLLGLFLCIYPGITLMVLPLLLGIWLMYHSFMLIAFGGDLDTFRIDGGGMVVVGGVILLVLSILILVNPLSAGIATIVVIAGAGLLVLGILICWIALKFKSLGRYQEKEYPR